MTEQAPRPTFEELDFARPKPVTLPNTLAFFLFASARTADLRGDTAARAFWLDLFQEHLEMEQS